MILAGDVGGTKTNLAVYDDDGPLGEPVVEATYPSQEHESLDEIVQTFVADHDIKPDYACIGVAGPVLDGRAETANLPWSIDGHRLASQLGIRSVELINDLEANAYGIGALEPDDFAVLNEGLAGATGNAAVIAAGTGLGQAILYFDGHDHHPFASEGGHADFAPRDELECELLMYLRQRFERVSYERVLSGPGITSIYEFLRDSGRGEEPAWLAEQLTEGDPSAAISAAAQAGTSALCVTTLELFCSIYGSEAGNLALRALATGGVYLGGGIAPKILDILRGPGFVDAFMSKGRMRSLVEGIPVRVVLNDKAALLGAARRASQTIGRH